jgi:hypothetical protein
LRKHIFIFYENQSVRVIPPRIAPLYSRHWRAPAETKANPCYIVAIFVIRLLLLLLLLLFFLILLFSLSLPHQLLPLPLLLLRRRGRRLFCFADAT